MQLPKPIEDLTFRVCDLEQEDGSLRRAVITSHTNPMKSNFACAVFLNGDLTLSEEKIHGYPTILSRAGYHPDWNRDFLWVRPLEGFSVGVTYRHGSPPTVTKVSQS